MIKELIPKVGSRAKFRNKLEELRKTAEVNVSKIFLTTSILNNI